MSRFHVFAKRKLFSLRDFEKYKEGGKLHLIDANRKLHITIQQSELLSLVDRKGGSQSYKMESKAGGGGGGGGSNSLVCVGDDFRAGEVIAILLSTLIGVKLVWDKIQTFRGQSEALVPYLKARAGELWQMYEAFVCAYRVRVCRFIFQKISGGGGSVSDGSGDNRGLSDDNNIDLKEISTSDSDNKEEGEGKGVKKLNVVADVH